MAHFSTDTDHLIVSAKNRKEFKELELLLLARSIPFTTRNDFWQKSLFIPLNYDAYARSEIRSYLAENADWPPVEQETESRSFRFSPLNVVIVVGLTLFHWHSYSMHSPINWLKTGRFSADAILQGEFWRTITALTLHLDDAHLLSNFFGLLVFVGGVNYFAGFGVAWFLVLFSGGVGNLANALFYQTAHYAVGASTAVFSAVGLVSVFAIKQYHKKRRLRGRYLVPFMAGFGLFAMLGTNPETDVMAHLFGFLAGAVSGLIFMPLLNQPFLKSRVFQVVVFCCFLFVIYVCWQYAISGGGRHILPAADFVGFRSCRR